MNLGNLTQPSWVSAIPHVCVPARVSLSPWCELACLEKGVGKRCFLRETIDLPNIAFCGGRDGDECVWDPYAVCRVVGVAVGLCSFTHPCVVDAWKRSDWGELLQGSHMLLWSQPLSWSHPQGGKGERGLPGPSGLKGEKGARVSAPPMPAAGSSRCALGVWNVIHHHPIILAGNLQPGLNRGGGPGSF